MPRRDDSIPIVQGIRMTPEGEVTVDPEVDEALFDLAIALQGPDDTPVDVEHVVAALILASRKGEVPSDYRLRERDKALQAILRPHVRTIFNRFGGQVCEEE
ncbi:MAG TPA: hypothetical protein VF170_15480 [Planctomycetaceae bacterium]